MSKRKKEFHSFSRSAAIFYGVGAAIILSDAQYRLCEDGVETDIGLMVEVSAEDFFEKYCYLDVESAMETLNEKTPIRFSRVGDRIRITDILHDMEQGGDDE